MDDKIKNAFQNWEENPTGLTFDKEKVWAAIQPQKKKRFVLYYPAAAAVAFIFLLGSWGYFLYSNQQMEQQYQAKVLEITQQKKNDVKVIEKKEVKTEIKTEIKEVVKESSELKAKVELLEKKLAKAEQEKEMLNNKLVTAVSQVEYLQDSVSLLKTDEVKPLLAEQRAKDKKKSKEIRININEEALADLPINRRKKENKKGANFKVVLKKEISETSALLFTSIQLK